MSFLNLIYSPWGTFLLIIFALIIGSFLNVVIYRLPTMLFASWREQCQLLLAEPPEKTTTFNLCWPASHCPKCKNPLKFWQNIPVFSYLLQRGKCQFCHQPISLRYPAVELISAGTAGLLFYLYGWSWPLLFALMLSWGLLVLIFIDIDTQLLPDEITLFLLWLGLLVNTQGMFTDLHSAIYGAVGGYMSLWLIAKSFLLLTKREGMGHGDFKLLALIGAWAGWQMLLPTLLMASFVGALVGLAMIVAGKLKREQPIPFGPFLAVAGWICLLWGKPLLNWWQGI
ncbi:MAG: A24 family peptidase [Gammaproteobacteria bacterium]|nr:A24 family peptidase [Gammaproteobacteria bacterium]